MSTLFLIVVAPALTLRLSRARNRDGLQSQDDSPKEPDRRMARPGERRWWNHLGAAHQVCRRGPMLVRYSGAVDEGSRQGCAPSDEGCVRLSRAEEPPPC